MVAGILKVINYLTLIQGDQVGNLKGITIGQAVKRMMMVTIDRREIHTEDSFSGTKRKSVKVSRKELSIAVKELEGDVFEELLVDVLKRLLVDHKVYFVFSEAKPQLQTRLRSYKKMFFEEQKEGVLKPKDIVNVETIIDHNLSLLSSIVSITRGSINNVVPELLTKNFRFAFIVKKGTRSFPLNRELFLDKLIHRVVKNQKFDRSEIKKIAQRITGKNKHSFRIVSGGKGSEKLEIIIDGSNEQVIDRISKIGQKYRSLSFN